LPAKIDKKMQLSQAIGVFWGGKVGALANNSVAFICQYIAFVPDF